MDKTNEVILNHHQVSILERKTIILNGIKKIISFDSEEFLMDSNMGTILLKGEDLEIIRLDTNDGNVSIKGLINSLNYLDNTKEGKESFLSKLFK